MRPMNKKDQAWLSHLLNGAERARSHAYAPYSNYMVGAAIETSDGSVFTGCNVECADYDGTHAEEAALALMVLKGYRTPERLLVTGGTERNTSKDPEPRGTGPCGKCRQKLYEFNPQLRVYLPTVKGWQIALINELLPRAFGPHNLK